MARPPVHVCVACSAREGEQDHADEHDDGAEGGLAAGLNGLTGKELLDGAARRLRALTAFDRVTFLAGRSKATSSRSGVPFAEGANATLSDDFPQLVADSRHEAIPVFPREDQR